MDPSRDIASACPCRTLSRTQGRRGDEEGAALVELHRLRNRPAPRPPADEQDGYVPYVVYSCGFLVHAGTLVVPFGIGDSSIGIATAAMPELFDALQA